MRSRRWAPLLAVAVGLAVLPSLLLPATAGATAGRAAAPAVQAAPAAPAGVAVDGSTTVTYDVPTRRGILHLEVVHPTLGGVIVQAPAILTYSPYSVLGRNGDADHWTPLGYARMYADVVGTDDSGGCYDYGGLGEQESGYDLVEWIAAQPWSTGKVGMIGASYDGTTQYATAITHPPHLTTIIPEAAISRWYDYAYSGGIRYTDTSEELGYQGPGAVTDEGVDTPAAFDFGFSAPPPTDVTDPTYAQRVQDKLHVCDKDLHTTKAYSLEPTVDDFWNERDYVTRLPSVTIPVLVASNWGDWNVKQIEAWDAYHALTGSRFARMYMGTRWAGHGTPPGDAYSNTVDAWFAHFLQGAANNIETTLPPVTTETSDSTGPLTYSAGPEPATTPLTLAAAPDGSLTATPGSTLSTKTFTITGTNTESAAGTDYSAAAASFLSFTSAPLTKDLHLYGEPSVTVTTSTGRSFVTLVTGILDVNPATRNGTTATTTNAAVAITRGWLDSRYRDGLDHEVTLPKDTPFAFNETLKPTDYIFRAGHRITLLIQSEAVDWAVAKPDPTCVGLTCTTWTVGTGARQTTLTLPVAAAAAAAPATLPEAGSAVVLPTVALLVLGGVVVVRRRRRA